MANATGLCAPLGHALLLVRELALHARRQVVFVAERHEHPPRDVSRCGEVRRSRNVSRLNE
eukprot:1672725-Lingulodinium_polyedra.AAC.1